MGVLGYAGVTLIIVAFVRLIRAMILAYRERNHTDE
uniref:Uncharacterized protein n=1 Tax=Siphoviridae sp. ct5Px37 TaxID=2826293 RepID=A0A8S5N429_9CAUD|nr:MAG TPA: hypothetical protein [Siphoviridae sp. ct5Px37]